MSETFYSKRFKKSVWLTNHAIEAMTKRSVTLPELKKLMEYGDYREKETAHGWVYYEFSERDDNLVCAAIVNKKAVVIKTVMIKWQTR